MPIEARVGMRWISLFVVVGVLAAAVLAPSASADPTAEGRYIVVLEDDVSHPGEVAERHAENRGAKVSDVYRYAIKGYAAKLPPAEARAVARDPAVAYVEPDARGGIAAQTTPTGIDRIFAGANERLFIDGEDGIRANVDVAVFDTGIDAGHPDLNVVSQVNCSGGGGSCGAGGSDGNGHGTHVAGTIAAIDNGFGVVGVAPGARLWSVKVLDNGGFGYLSELIAGIDWVTARADTIEVANASLRYWGTSSSKAFEEATDSSIEAGVVQVAAAGNESEPVKYVPGNHPDVITVSALQDFDGLPGEEEEGKDPLAGFSNYGSLVDIAAPGVAIRSTWPGNNYVELEGTSMASPHVAGAAAVLASIDDPESQADVEAIRDTLVETGNYEWEDNSGDETQEPLLDVGDEATFDLGGPDPGTWTPTSGIADTRATAEDIACRAPGQCISVGAHTDAFGARMAQILKLYVYPPTEEPYQVPGGAESTELKALDCVGETECHAVGSFIDSEGVERPFALRWHESTGAEWKAQAAAPPAGATAGSLSDVSCGPAGCLAVGSYREGGQAHLVAYEWTGSAWSQLEAPEPAEALESELEGVSCRFGGGQHLVVNEAEEEEWVEVEPACLAVGRYTDGSEEERSLLLRYDSSGWQVLEAPSPAEAQAAGLNGVSCGPGGLCVATGGYRDGEGDAQTLAIAFDGSEWALSSTPTPAGAEEVALAAVDCEWSPALKEEAEPKAPACGAVGSYRDGGDDFPLGLTWDGSAWIEREMIDWLPTTVTDAEFNGLVCQQEECWAVGSLTHDDRVSVFGNGGGPPGEGPWSISQFTGDSTSVTGLSCGSSTECMAVGTTVPLPLPEQPRTVVGWAFDASDWTPGALAGTNPALNAVSCSAPEACTAFGDTSTNTAFLVRRWNGTSWASQSAPIPVAGHRVHGTEVSCPSSTFCMAAGWHHPVGSNAYKGVVERWNGSSWSVDWNSGLGYAAEPLGISCASTSSCVAVGRYKQTSTGSWKAMALVWNGSSWSVELPPEPAGMTSSGLATVSCTSSTACTAGGSYWDSSDKKVAFVVRWDGSSWATEYVPRPAGRNHFEIHDVSCWEDAGCRAIGVATTPGLTTTALKWRGGQWGLESMPLNTVWRAWELDCTAVDHCVAVGNGNSGVASPYPEALTVEDNE